MAMFCMQLFCGVKENSKKKIATMDISLLLKEPDKFEEFKHIVDKLKKEKGNEWLDCKPIHVAAALAIKQKQNNILVYLLAEKFKIDVELRAEGKLSAVEYAVEYNNIHALKIMLEYDQNNPEAIKKAMIKAVSKLNVEMCAYLLEKGVDPDGMMPHDDSRGKGEFNFLAAAIMDGGSVKNNLPSATEEREKYKAIAKLLLQHKANAEKALEQIKAETMEKEENYNPRLQVLVKKHSDSQFNCYHRFFEEVQREFSENHYSFK
jgi:hypothetical protein